MDNRCECGVGQCGRNSAPSGNVVHDEVEPFDRDPRLGTHGEDLFR